MLYLSEKAMNLEELFMENGFTKRGESFYFASVEEKDDTYLCIKLWNKFDDKRFELEVVRVTIDEDKEDEPILTEEVVTDKQDRETAIHGMFSYISYEDNLQNVMFFEGVYELIKEYIEEAYFYSEENKLIGEFMEVFSVEGTAVEGYYEGNVVLREVALWNRHTGQEIKSFNAVNITSLLYFEEDDDAEYMIECLLDSMSEHDIKEKLMEIENQEE